MESLFNWLKDNSLYCSIIALIIGYLLGLVSIDKLKMASFTASQFIRKTLGRKVEKKVEDIVDAIDEGLKADNDKE